MSTPAQTTGNFGCGAKGIYFFNELSSIEEIKKFIQNNTTHNQIVFSVLTSHQLNAIQAYKELGGYCVIEKINDNTGNRVGLYFLCRSSRKKTIAHKKVKRLQKGKKK